MIARLPPTMVIETSAGNIQCRWFFSRGIRDYDEAARLCTALRDFCGCDDGTMTPTHAWRPPGLFNRPNAKKVYDDGRTRTPQVSRCIVDRRNEIPVDSDDLLQAILKKRATLANQPRLRHTVVPAPDNRQPADSFQSLRKVSAAEARQKAGKIVFDPNAKPDAERLETLRDLFETDFVPIWDWKKKGLRDFASQSEADLALSNLAADAGWTPQEITDLLIYFRRREGADLKSSQYYEITVGKAIVAAEEKNVTLRADQQSVKKKAGIGIEPKEDRQASLNFLRLQTGLPIVRFVQHGMENPGYTLYLEGGPGDIISFKNGELITSLAKFKRTIFDSGHEYRSPKCKWDLCLSHFNTIREYCRFQFDTQATRVGSYISAFLHWALKNNDHMNREFDERIASEKAECIENGEKFSKMHFRFHCRFEPIRIKGVWHIPSRPFYKYCKLSLFVDSKYGSIKTQLSQAGCESVSITSHDPKDEDPKSRKPIYYWKVPPEILPSWFEKHEQDLSQLEYGELEEDYTSVYGTERDGLPYP